MAVSTDRIAGLPGSLGAMSEQDIENALALSPVPALVLDESFKIAALNPEAEVLLSKNFPGLPFEGNLIDALPPAGQDALKSLARSLSVSSQTVARDRLYLSGNTEESRSVSILARRISWRGEDGLLCFLPEAPAPVTNRPKDEAGETGGHDTYLREAIEAMSEGFALFDADRRLVMFNENYRTQIWPLLSDFIRVGLRFEEIVAETLRRNVWRQSGVDVQTLNQQAIERHEDVPSVHEIRYPDGRCIQQSKQRTSDGGIVAVYSDITDLISREDQMTETQDRHRRLLETLPDGVVIHSGGKFAYVNPAVVEMFGGRKHTDLIGRNSADFLPPEDRAESLARLERVLNERKSLPPEEQRRIRLDGRIVPVEVRHTFIQWNGKPAILTVLRDLTERKRAEHALQETEHRYLTLAANLPGAVYQRVMYPDGTISYPYVSPGLIETHGLDAEEVMQDGKRLTGTIHPEDRDRFGAALENSARYLTAFDIEVRNLKPDGTLTWIRSLARPRLRDDGAIVWDGIFVDINARRRAEETAAQSYRWLTDAIQSMSDGFALWDPEDRLILWNDRFLEGHPDRENLIVEGMDFATMTEKTSANLRKIRDEKEVAEWMVRRLRRHQEAQGSHELQTAIGRWLLVTERRTPEGYIVGIYTDITDLKNATQQLTESEQRYRRLVEVSPDAVFVHRNGKIVFANNAAVAMHDVASVDDLIGSSILGLIVEDDHLKVMAQYRQSVSEDSSDAYMRFRSLRPDGAVRHCESVGTSISWEGEEARLVLFRDIEDRVQAERQQALFGAVMDQAADSIEMADLDFNLTYVNPAFEEMTGYTAEEVIGEKPGEFLRPHDVGDDFYRRIEETIRAGLPWSGVMNALRKDGSTFQLEASISPVFNETGDIENFVGIKRDITEREETQHALRESEERYRKLLALTPDAIYVHAGSTIVLANDAALDVFGASSEEDLVGRSIFDLLHPDMVAVAEENQARVLSEDVHTLRIEQKRLRLDGEEFWANVSVTPLTWQGERGALVILRDVTEQRQAQNELIRAMEAAEIASKSKSEFLANMSHELRTPLNAIIGFSEIMTNGMFGPIGNEQYDGYARDIHESGMHLLYVINDILDLSKIEAGKLSIRKTDVDLAEAIEMSQRIIRKSADDAHVSVETRIDKDLPVIQADKRMLKQMLMNLASNAIKFTPSGGKVRISASRAGADFVKIAVVDTGIGIERSEIPKMLEPFVQAENPVELRQPGTGLGLPLTKSLVELHGGTFQLWSRVGFGTRAVIRLPVRGGDTS